MNLLFLQAPPNIPMFDPFPPTNKKETESEQQNRPKYCLLHNTQHLLPTTYYLLPTAKQHLIYELMHYQWLVVHGSWFEAHVCGTFVYYTLPSFLDIGAKV